MRRMSHQMQHAASATAAATKIPVFAYENGIVRPGHRERA
jgi:hypothetical protein